jgi:excisionase family DNA binding protein
MVLFTINEVAYWFGVSRNLIQREVAKGRIQVHKLGEGTKTSPVRISFNEVKRYLGDRLRRGLPIKR